MNVTATPRDYSLIGRDSKLAEELGLVSAEWYKAPIARKRLKELMQRSDDRRHPRHADLDRRLHRHRRTWRSISGPAGGRCRSFSPMAFSTGRRRIRAGMNAATAPPSRHAG